MAKKKFQNSHNTKKTDNFNADKHSMDNNSGTALNEVGQDPKNSILFGEKEIPIKKKKPIPHITKTSQKPMEDMNLNNPSLKNNKPKKKKQTHSNSNFSQTTETLIADVDSTNSSAKKKMPNNNSLSNFCQNKCLGLNNWNTFLNSMQLENVEPSGSHTVTRQKANHNRKATSLVPRNSKRLLNNIHTNQSSKIPSKTEDPCRSNKEKPNAKGKVLTKQIAMDCEMVGVEIGVKKSIVARVSLVNSLGDCIYDKFVKPTEPVLDYRTHVSGVREENLANADDFKTVQEEVATILKGRVLVGHALKQDLSVLFLTHPRKAIRDTSKFKKFSAGKTPSLKSLAKNYLGVTIQDGEHSSVQDALAAMQLYRMFKNEWENSIKMSNKLKMKKKSKQSDSLSLKKEVVT